MPFKEFFPPRHKSWGINGVKKSVFTHLFSRACIGRKCIRPSPQCEALKKRRKPPKKQSQKNPAHPVLLMSTFLKLLFASTALSWDVSSYLWFKTENNILADWKKIVRLSSVLESFGFLQLLVSYSHGFLTAGGGNVIRVMMFRIRSCWGHFTLLCFACWCYT